MRKSSFVSQRASVQEYFKTRRKTKRPKKKIISLGRRCRRTVSHRDDIGTRGVATRAPVPTGSVSRVLCKTHRANQETLGRG